MVNGLPVDKSILWNIIVGGLVKLRALFITGEKYRIMFIQEVVKKISQLISVMIGICLALNVNNYNL
jgi:hypothetical protein